MFKFMRKKRFGFITPMAAVFALFLFVLGIGLLFLGFNRRIFSIRSNHRLAARCAADYGVTKAVYTMNLLLPGCVASPLPSESSVQVPGSDAKYSYIVTGTCATGYSVQSTGSCGGSTKTVRCDLRLKGIFEYAILTKG